MATKPNLVLLHGVGLDHTMWEPVAERLLDRYEVFALDLPGHGGKSPVPDGVTLADLVAGLLDELPGRAHLVGFSLGALVAQHLARHRPDLVSTLTSVSSVCRRTSTERAAVLDRLAAAQADFVGSVAASINRWYDGADVDPAVVRRTEATLLANDRASFVRCYTVFATGDADIFPELGAITRPSLAVTGACDRGSTPEMTHRLARAIPNCRAVIVPDARHMLPLEQPHAFVECLTTFIGEYAHV